MSGPPGVNADRVFQQPAAGRGSAFQDILQRFWFISMCLGRRPVSPGFVEPGAGRLRSCLLPNHPTGV